MSSEKSFEIYSADDLRKFCIACFLKSGVPEQDAELIADHLVSANLRGVDSHGVIRLPYYLEGMERGLVKPKAEIKVMRETPFSALIDGGQGLGIVVADKAAGLAVSKARSTGIGLIGVRNLGHVGMLAYYAIKIANEKFIGFVCANCPSAVAPWGGMERLFGTNPLSIGIPAGKWGSIIIDMATSAIAEFKIHVAMRQGKQLPPGAALDKDGNPTVDPKAALEGCLLPFGEYKGYAFSLLVEVLANAFVGGPMSKEIVHHPSTQGGFLVAALDPSLFRDYQEFEKDLLKIIDTVKNCKLARTASVILLPGEKENNIYAIRRRQGIPIDAETLKFLRRIAERLDIQFPKKLA